MRLKPKIKNIIVSTHDSLCPIMGGGALRTLKVADEFKKRGHNVIIIAPTDKVGWLNGIKVHWLHPPRKQRSQILSSLKFNIRLLRKFLKFIKNTDMVFVHNTIAAATIPFLKKIFRFRFVLDISDIHAEYLPIGKRNIFEKILTPFLLNYEYHIIKSADFIITVTNVMKNLLIQKGISSNKIGVVYDGVSLNNFYPQKEPGSDLGIIHLGAIDRQHGVEDLTRAIPSVMKEFSQAKFYFVGGGRELANIKNLAKELKISHHCIFTDYLTCEEAERYLRKASIGVIPRKDYLPNRIITTLKLYEYWASGTAVVSSCLKGIQEVAKDYEDVLFFEAGNVNDLAQKLLFLLKNKELRIYLIKNALRTVEKFSWEKLIPKIVDFSLSFISLA